MEENLAVTGMGSLRAHRTPRQPVTLSPAHRPRGPSSHTDAECPAGRKSEAPCGRAVATRQRGQEALG